MPAIPRFGVPKRQPSPSGSKQPAQPPAPDPYDSVVAWGWYVDGVKQDCADLDFATSRAKVGHGWVWLGLKDPDDEDMSGFATMFDLHPLAIEDAVEGHTRSKVEQFDDTLFAVISTVKYVEHTQITDSSEIVSTGQIMVFVGPSFVLTVRRGEHASLGNLRTRVEADAELLRFGPSSILYAVLDKVIDDYVAVVAAFEEDIEEVEALVYSRQGVHEVDRVYQLKRELIEFKRATVPLGAPLLALAGRPYPLIPEEQRAYFRELSDHHLEAREAITSFDDVLSSLLTAGLTRASVADNQDMRKISAAVAILAVPTTIGAVYGMNFENLPELHWHYAYYVVMAVNVILMAVLFVVFKKHRWL